MRSATQQPFRCLASLGLVTDGSSTSCNSVVHRQGLANFFTTPVDSGKALHLYDVKLNLKGVSKPLSLSFLPELQNNPITTIAAHGELTFAAVGTAIVVYHRLRPLQVLRFHTSNVTLLTVVSNILISVGTDSTLIAWLIPQKPKQLASLDESKLSEIQLPPDFIVSAVTHPASYLNKILLGSVDGRLMLVNLKTETVIHTFRPFSQAAVTVLQSSPIADVIAIGTAAGRIFLHNIKADKTVLEFQHASHNAAPSEPHPEALTVGKSITSISFMSTSLELLISTDSSGDVFVWNLNEKRLLTQLWQAHQNGIRSAFLLHGEPLLVTFGRTDNAIKIHIFEDRKNAFRLLRARDGHSLPPTVVQFAAKDGLMLVSAGLDRRLRLVSLVNDARNTFFAQPSLQTGDSTKPKPRKRRRKTGEENTVRAGGVNFTLPPVSNLAMTDARTGSDANILTTHLETNEVFTWDLESKTLKSRLRLPNSKPRVLRLATAQKQAVKKVPDETNGSGLADVAVFVELSTCGNYAYIGSRHGRIHSFNIQSSIHQGVFADSACAAVASDWGKAHSDQIRCLAVDTNGETLASVATVERCVKLWNVYSRKMDGNSIPTPSEVMSLQWCKSSNLLAMGCEDFTVIVCDSATRKIARRFNGHHGPLVGMAFDNRGRRIVSAAEDNTIRVWDLASGQDAGCVVCEETPTSIALAPNSGYLASTHANSLSVKVWADVSELGAVAHADTAESVGDSVDGEERSDDRKNNQPERFGTSQRKGNENGGVTLSSKPPSHWTVLQNMRQIKERNKPTEAPKKPRDAPFFISERIGMEDTSEHGKKTKQPSKKSERNSFEKAIKSENFQLAEEILYSSDSSGVDFHLRSSEGARFRRNAVQFFLRALEGQTQLELVQAYLTVFLQEHGLAIAQDEGSSDMLEKLLQAQRTSWTSLRGSLDTVTSLCSFFSGLV